MSTDFTVAGTWELTTLSITNSTTEAEGATYPLWAKIFDNIQEAFTAVGFLANVLTLITLCNASKGFSRLILVLLRHQALVDALVCGMATALLLQPHGWMTGNKVFDAFVCHTWHGQAFYWGAVTLSTYNLVLVAFERYLAICRPFLHNEMSVMSRWKMASYGAVLYVLCLLITHGTYIQTRVENGECTYQYAFSGKAVDIYFFAFVIFTYITTYFVPAVTMATLYGIVANQLRKRQRDLDLGKSKTVDRASAQLTKTAVTVTIIFIVSIGYDLHYYLLGYTGVTEYELNSAVQKVGVFLSNLNSCLNPFVYAVLMPIYRKSVMTTFCSCLDRGEPGSAENSTHSNSSTKNGQTTRTSKVDLTASSDTINSHI